MILLAIDLYGIRPFEKPQRITFKPGFNTVVGQNGSGKTMVYQVLSSLFSDTPSNYIAFTDNQTTQAAVMFRTQDHVLYRIARDYRQEVWNLSQMDTATQKFKTLETDRGNIFEWLRETVGGLDENERGLLFMIDRLRLPSHTPHAAGSGAESDTPHFERTVVAGNGGIQPKQEGLPEDGRLKAEKDLKEAERELDALTEVEDQMLLKQDEAAAIRKRLSLLEDIQQKTKRMEEVCQEKYAVFVSEGTMSSEQEQAYEAGKSDLQSDMDEVVAEAQSLEAALISRQTLNRGKDPIIITGLAIAVLSILLPFAVTLLGPARFIFLGGFLGGNALAGFGYFKRSRAMTEKEKIEKQLKALKERGRRRQSVFEKEYAVLLGLIEKTGAKDFSEFKNSQQAYLNLIGKKEAALKKAEETLAGETPGALQAQSETLDAEAADLQEKLKDQQQLSEEVYRLQESLREFDAPMETSDPTFAGLPGLEVSSPGPLATDFVSVLNISGERPSERRARLEHDAGILFRRFRPGHAAPIQVREDGGIFVGETPLHHLSDGVADQVFLSLTLSVISQFPEVPFPLFIDDPFTALDQISRQTAIRILQIISKKRQVILFTAHAEASQIGHTFELASGY